MNREEIREKTMQLIYQMDITGEFDYEKLSPVEENARILGKKQALLTLQAVRDHIGEIDDVIRACLDRWSFERVARTDLAILRTAVAEMMYVDSVPNSVSINEAVRMAKRFCEEKSYGFVNSVLSKVNKYLSDADRNGEED
jgi:N utilization substance protein B